MRKTHRKDERREKISTKRKGDNDCYLCFNMYDGIIVFLLIFKICFYQD
jgi:hypothetical protein